MNSKTLAKFNAPGLGYDLVMSQEGGVYLLGNDGKPETLVAFRDEEGVWHQVQSFPIINSQLVEKLEKQYISL